MGNPETGGNPAASQQYSCTQCGAKLNFAPGTSALRCPYCGFESRIANSEARIAELDYQSYFEKAAREKALDDTQRVRCNQCGAQITVSGGTAADICPFCGANMVFSGSLSRLIKPEGVLPFKIGRKEAVESFRRWIRKLWFAPGGLKQFAQADDRLAGVYIPFWTYDSDTTTDYAGERGDYYYTTENYAANVNGRSVTRSRRVRHTRWSGAAGTVRNRFDDILIRAGNSLPGKFVDDLTPWDLTNLVPYKDEYLSGFRAETYQVPLPQGFEAARKVMAPVIEESIRRDIGGDEQRIQSARTRYDDITFKHILLPVWVSAYRFHGKIFRLVINGRTGEVQGERPLSAWKIAGAVLAVLVIIGILIIIKQN